MSETTTLPASPGGPKTEPLIAGMTRVQPGDTIRLGDIVHHPGIAPVQLDAHCVGQIVRPDDFPIWRPKPDPAGALKAIMAAAEGCEHRNLGCFYVKENGCFCGDRQHVHEGAFISHTHSHPFVSLSTLLSSVVELSSAPLLAEKREVQSILGCYVGESFAQTAEKYKRELAEVTQQRDALRSQVQDVWRAGLTVDTRIKATAAATGKTDEWHKCVSPNWQWDIYDYRISPPPAAESYRLLETGEIIQAGDQWQRNGQWQEAKSHQCLPVQTGGTFRRPITGGAGLHEAATVSQEPAVSDGFLPRLAALEDAGLILSELPAAEARLVIAALATVFSV